MGFIASLFGSTKPTAAAAADKLAEVEADLAAMPARIAVADKALANVGDLTDEEHAAAMADATSLRRLEDRLKDQRGKLIATRDLAQADEAADDLDRRAGDAAKRLKSYAKLIGQYEAQSAALAATLAEMSDIESEADAINRESATARKAGLRAPEPIKTPAEVHRREPDVVEPDRTVVEEKVVSTESSTRYDADGEAIHESRTVPVGITVRKLGKVILGAGERIEKVKRVIPGRTRYGKSIGSPTNNVALPAARIGGKAFWPK